MAPFYVPFARPLAAPLAAGLLAGCTRLDSTVVDFQGRAVEVVVAGDGDATVVFEAGLGDGWRPWDAVASDVADHARIFAYSRPGYGQSGATTAPRDPATLVEELRLLLASQDLRPPYVLVGHSFGGTYMELFARSHPDEVSAAVLAEPRPSGFLDRASARGSTCAGSPPTSWRASPTRPPRNTRRSREEPPRSTRPGAAGTTSSSSVRTRSPRSSSG